MEKLNVAIVDDNPLILNTLDELINAEDGLSVIGKADNGADAINMIVDTTPDIVLLDLVMPKIDGISVVEKVKSEHTFLKNPAFIILSAVGGEQMTEDAFKAGANYYLMKPFDKEILVNKIRHIGKLPDKQPAGKVLTAPFEPGEESHITREEYMKEHLETDITKMLHELGIPAHIKGISVSERCYRHVGGRPGNDEQRDENPLSGHSQTQPDNGQPGGTCHTSCHRGGLGQRQDGNHR